MLHLTALSFKGLNPQLCRRPLLYTYYDSTGGKRLLFSGQNVLNVQISRLNSQTFVMTLFSDPNSRYELQRPSIPPTTPTLETLVSFLI